MRSESSKTAGTSSVSISKPRKQANLSHDQIMKLISYVNSNKELCFKRDRNFKLTKHKDSLWEAFIVKHKLKFNLSAVKTCWSNLRQRFVNTWRKNGFTDSYPEQTEKWPYYRSLMFLIEDLKSDETLSIGIGSSKNDSAEDYDNEFENEEELDDEYEDKMDYIQESSDTESISNDNSIESLADNEDGAFCLYLSKVLSSLERVKSSQLKYDVFHIIYYITKPDEPIAKATNDAS